MTRHSQLVATASCPAGGAGMPSLAYLIRATRMLPTLACFSLKRRSDDERCRNDTSRFTLRTRFTYRIHRFGVNPFITCSVVLGTKTRSVFHMCTRTWIIMYLVSLLLYYKWLPKQENIGEVKRWRDEVDTYWKDIIWQRIAQDVETAH